MTRLRRAARLLLLTTFVVGWAGSTLSVPGLVLLSAHGHGHGHEVEFVVGDGHRDAILRHADHPPHDAPHGDEAPLAGVPHDHHSDHTVHLPEVDPAVSARSLTAPAPTFAAVVALAWTMVPQLEAPPARPPARPEPVPDGPLAALRTTVLLV